MHSHFSCGKCEKNEVVSIPQWIFFSLLMFCVCAFFFFCKWINIMLWKKYEKIPPDEWNHKKETANVYTIHAMHRLNVLFLALFCGYSSLRNWYCIVLSRFSSRVESKFSEWNVHFIQINVKHWMLSFLFFQILDCLWKLLDTNCGKRHEKLVKINAMKMIKWKTNFKDLFRIGFSLPDGNTQKGIFSSHSVFSSNVRYFQWHSLKIFFYYY